MQSSHYRVVVSVLCSLLFLLALSPSVVFAADGEDFWEFHIAPYAWLAGFGAGSDFMWDLNANLGYRWGEMFSTTIGYRYLDVDYENDGFLYDVAQQGPTLGMSWRF